MKTEENAPFGNTSDKAFYRWIALAAFAVLVLAAATFILPKLFTGAKQTAEVSTGLASKAGGIVSDTAADAGQAAKTATKEVQKAVTPKGYSELADGADGVVRMFKSDPLYDGSKVTVVTNEDEWLKDNIGFSMLETDGLTDKLIVIRYHQDLFYFANMRGLYTLTGYTAVGQKVAGSVLGAQPIPLGREKGYNYREGPAPLTALKNGPQFSY